jgi:hypothetical protein
MNHLQSTLFRATHMWHRLHFETACFWNIFFIVQQWFRVSESSAFLGAFWRGCALAVPFMLWKKKEIHSLTRFSVIGRAVPSSFWLCDESHFFGEPNVQGSNRETAHLVLQDREWKKLGRLKKTEKSFLWGSWKAAIEQIDTGLGRLRQVEK